MSKRQSATKPLTKGKALIAARELLGPAATTKSGRYSIGFHGLEFNGVDWEAALEECKESDAAKAWSDAKIAASNEIALAENSLKLAQKQEAFKGFARVKKITESQFRKIRVSLRGSAKCACGKTISANKNHCAQCPSQLRPELPEAAQ